MKLMVRPCLLATIALLCGAVTGQQSSDNPPTIGELFPSDTGAPMALRPIGSGMPVVSGSELSAGVAPAMFRLNRGGQIRICPRSSLSVNSSGYGLMLSMSGGAIVVEDRLTQKAADILLTPDFSIQMTGPAVYRFALGVDKNGTTCMKTLPGSSPVTFTELLGSGVYRSRQNDSVQFSKGSLAAMSAAGADCGCPAGTPVTVANAQATPSPAPVTPQAAPSVQPGQQAQIASDPTAPVPEDQPGQIHVQVDAPFVFNARESAGAVKPYSVAKIRFSNLPNAVFAQEQVDPIVLPEKTVEVSPQEGPAAEVKPEEPKKEKKGFFGRVKGFFGSMFHRK